MRVPPGHLFVVDCFRTRKGQRNLVTEILTTRPEPVEAVILTHPHHDHAPGLGDVLGAYKDCLVGCCERLWVEPYDKIRNHPDLGKRLSEGQTAQTLTAIRAAWGDPTRKWDLVAGSVRSVGDAKLTALFPTAARLAEVEQEGIKGGINSLSSPILLEWRDVRLLLGADLERHWPDVHGAADVRSHHGYKVAHHASETGFDASILRPAAGMPPWFATPWSLAGGMLPDFADGGGVAQILAEVNELLLTAVAFSVPSGTGSTRTRDWLLKASRGEDPDVPGATATVESSDVPEDAWLGLTFGPSGECRDVRQGARALKVTAWAGPTS